MVCVAGLLVVLAEARYRNHVFTNDFVVHAEGEDAAHRIAKRHGLQVIRSVSFTKNLLVSNFIENVSELSNDSDFSSYELC